MVIIITVSLDGTADFQYIQEAVNSISDERDETVTIFIRNGIYNEKIWMRKNKIKLVGESCDKTIIRYNDGAKKLRPDGTEYRTFNTATALFAGCDITVCNLTIENYAGIGKVAGQAVAAYVASDRTAFYNCRFLGYQDTIFTGDVLDEPMKQLMLPDFFKDSSVQIHFEVTRNYFESCYICGDVDFIFGSNVAYFENCQIHSLKLASESGSFITAASTPCGQEFGYVFHNCKLTSDDVPQNVYLGRPWRAFAKTAFVSCELGEHIKPEGFHNWNKPNAEVTTSYVEFNNFGVGAENSKRASFSKQLTNVGLHEYFSKENVLGDWQTERDCLHENV